MRIVEAQTWRRTAETHKLGKADGKHGEPSKCGMGNAECGARGPSAPVYWQEMLGESYRFLRKHRSALNPHQPCPALAVLALKKYCSPNERTDFNQTRCLQRAAGGPRHAH